MATRMGPGEKCSGGECPDIFLLDESDAPNIARAEGTPEGGLYAVIGTLLTPQQLELPEGSGVGPGEAVVVIPEAVLLGAARALLASSDARAEQSVPMAANP